ncbi:MAG: 30S ribosomal protein S4e [Candidatus Bathyarchaeia archaeon]
MGKKGGSRHLKRFPSPAFWPIHVKEFQWVVKPQPGPHPSTMCFPISLIVKDVLHYAKTYQEARKIINDGKIKIDGRVRKDTKFPVGLMDVIEVPDTNSYFRVLPVFNRKLYLVPIPKEEASYKLCRIEGKTTIRGGHVQLNLHDGRNLLIRVKDPKKPEEAFYKKLDVVQISLPDQAILKHLKFDEKAYALVTAGKNFGKHGRITKIEKGTALRPSIVSIEEAHGELFQTIADYTFVIGEEKPIIKLVEKGGELVGFTRSA